MVISVITPYGEGVGNTTVSLFLALGLGNLKKKVLVTHTDNISSAFSTYLGVHQFADKTSTPTQLVKLLREGAIQAEAMPDYCTKIQDNSNVYAFTNTKTNFSEHDMETLSEYFVEQSDFEYIVYDMNDLESETSKYILQKSEVVVLNFSQSVIEKEKFMAYFELFKKKLEGKKIIIVCNKFNSLIGKDRDVAKGIHVPKAPVCVIHYNPYIVKFENTGNLKELYGYIQRRSKEVVELKSDIEKLASAVTKIKIAAVKARQEEKRNLFLKGGAGDAK